MSNNALILHFPPSSQVEQKEHLSSDEDARKQALDVEASWIVEAPAGSGKTGLLMQRYLKLLGHPGTSQPEEILAITFTRKATAELRERVLTQLQQAHASVDSTSLTPFDAATLDLAQSAMSRDAALGWGLLDRPQRLNIRTIDSVCAEIASTLPLLSGSGAARTPSLNPEPLYRIAASRTLMQLGGPDAALSAAIRNVLLHRDANLGDCETLLARMLAAREQWGELVPLGSQLEEETLENEVRPRLERALEQVVCAGLTRAAKAMPPDALQALTWLAQRWSGQPGYLGTPSPIAICHDRDEAPEARAEHLEHWRQLIDLVLTKEDWRKERGITERNLGFAFPKVEKPRLVEIISNIQSPTLRDVLQSVRNLPPPRYPDEQWAVAKSLFRLLVRALAELKVLFAEREECDFAELSMAAKQALRADNGATDLASAAGSTLRHLLVDEMQDTSSSQYELIEMLSRSWDGHSQTLFLVGDPKQSIYLFRQARVERFLRTMREKRIGDIHLGVLHLSANFRSQAVLVDHFNRDFAFIFPTPGEEDISDGQAPEVPFVEASPVRSPTPSAAGIVWHTAVLGDPDPTGAALPEAARQRQTHAREEARDIRHAIELWRNKPLPLNRKLGPDGYPIPWRIAVLARARIHLSPIIAEFDRRDLDGETIPFRALEIEKLGDRPEVLDALALTRALLHPADRVAWLAVLHAPWCGLGIADLLAISGGGASEAATEVLPAVAAARRDLLSPDGQPLFDRAWPILEAALAQRGRSSIATYIERTWRTLGGDVALSAQQLTNVEIFLSALREAEEPGGRVDLIQLAATVKRLYAEPRSGDNAVDISTIHKAKGLEWDVVFVPALERPGQNSRTEFLNWLELDVPAGDLAHIVLAPIWGKGGEPDTLHKWLTSIRSARDAAERKRLFYVACTRAREELHLFAAATRTKDGELTAKPGTLLQAAWPAAFPQFEQAAAAKLHTAPAEDLEYDIPLALAASADQHSTPAKRPVLYRLPLSFDPHDRFEATPRLQYTPAAALRQGSVFERPEGSHGVRAFGNVVHRYLQLLATRLDQNPNAEDILAELPTWLPRLTASLRSEGLAPSILDRLAQRSLHALQQAVTDEIGRWILSPHTAAHSEQALRLATLGSSEMRVDRTFIAGPTPLSEGATHLWIIDFKTTEQGSRSPDLFAQQEQAKYRAQLESYARAQRALPDTPPLVMLGLYYPTVPRFIDWMWEL